MKKTTVIFLFNAKGEVLLSLKKRGHGEGKRNGAGGKVEEGETIMQGAIRELKEEIGASLPESALVCKGILHFLFPERPEIDHICTIFFANYDGEVSESEEMAPQWFALQDIPYEKMRISDRERLPRLLAGEEEVEYRILTYSDHSETERIK